MRLNTRQSLLSEQINDVKSQVNIMKVELGSKMANISEIQADHKTRFENLSDFNPIRHKVCETQCRIVDNRQRCFIYGCSESTKGDYCDGNNDCQNGLLCENRYFLYFSKYVLYSSLKPMHPETSHISACWWSKAGESTFWCVPSIRRCNNWTEEWPTRKSSLLGKGESVEASYATRGLLSTLHSTTRLWVLCNRWAGSSRKQSGYP